MSEEFEFLEGQVSALGMALAVVIGTLPPREAARAAQALRGSLEGQKADDLADPTSSDRMMSAREATGSALVEALEQRSRAE